ncbi:MAG: RNA polymerase sigma-70 factor (ECF subfamily), partial [Paraglaciecola sp.]
MDSLSDAQLIKRTIQRRGDASLAYAMLYGRYQHKIAAYVGAKVNYNQALVDDV